MRAPQKQMPRDPCSTICTVRRIIHSAIHSACIRKVKSVYSWLLKDDM